MKNVYLFVVMMLTVVTYSQEKVIDSIQKKEKKFSMYYGGNVSFNDDFNLNKKSTTVYFNKFLTKVSKSLFLIGSENIEL